MSFDKTFDLTAGVYFYILNKSEIGNQPTMCQVRTGAYVSLLAPGKTDYTACHPRKTTRYHVYISRSTYHATQGRLRGTTYISHAVPITTHTHNRRKSVGKKKQRREDKTKKRKDKEAKKRKRKGKKRQEKQEKTRQEKEARKGKEEKNVILADPRN